MSSETIHFAEHPKLRYEYVEHQRHVQCVLDRTIHQRLLFIDPLLKGLGTGWSPSRISHIDAHAIHQYVIKTAPSLSRKYRKEFLCSLRSFFKFLLFKGYTKVRLMDALPKLPTWSLSEIPRGIEWESVQKLLSAPNRNRPNGKRNYALLLLMATYGVRYHQAGTLKLKNIHWHEGLIYFPPCKGGKSLTFPLYHDVAEALLDYIKNGRGRSPLAEVFLIKNGTEPMKRTSLFSTMQGYYKRMGIKSSTSGFHAIRHAFATKLMKEKTPIKNISDILGHSSIKSTYVYTKVDMAQLRTLCREWVEVRS
jgi:integrase/recombinase XerD